MHGKLNCNFLLRNSGKYALDKRGRNELLVCGEHTFGEAIVNFRTDEVLQLI